jgi:hypothetical protein
MAALGRLAAVATDAALLIVDPARLGGPDAVRWRADVPGAAIRALAVADVTGDGAPDLLVAHATTAGGDLELWRNDSTAGGTSFGRIATVALPQSPTAIVAGDFGGAPGIDVAVGFADGVRVFWCDGETLPPQGGDAVRTGEVTALAAGAIDPAGGPGDDLVVATRAAAGGSVRILVRGPAGPPLGAAVGR